MSKDQIKPAVINQVVDPNGLSQLRPCLPRHSASVESDVGRDLASRHFAPPAPRLPPAPANDFADFICTYYATCHARMPAIEAIAGKWTFEDLIPGMSDFDTRFICADTMTVNDWCRMSMIVGQVHLDLCRQYPKWARILEHLPGVNLVWRELTDEISYYPEYPQWTFYETTREQRLKEAHGILERRPWDHKDEYFHLKKFLLYYGPYDRSIDRPLNLGAFEAKYPLHSRLMHYFAPPLQSAVSICLKRPVRGKLEALRLAEELFPEITVFRETRELVARHYEAAELYMEPAISALEQRLFAGLQHVAAALGEHVSILPRDVMRGLPETWRPALKKIPVDPSLLIFDNAKFARLMRGRLFFYVNAPTRFDHVFLIQNELSRIGSSFFRVPFALFWKMIHGETVADPAAIVPRLVPDVLTKEQAACTLEFDRLTRLPYAGQQDRIAHDIIAIYDGFYHALFAISEITRKMEGTRKT
ncbi:MAG: hypothetical protein PHW60_04300 [Kiritimatiellae bacterium]|nr:hypothetical protein [Kiritimatiellia bacterium]